MNKITVRNDIPPTKHFRIRQLARGVFAAINREEGWAIGNAGIIDMGDSTLVFDTTLTPASAEELRQSAEILTGNPISYVVNSHYHNDHTWGNMQFAPQSLLISSSTTRDDMLDKGKEEYRFYKANASKRKAKIQKEYDKCKDELSRKALHSWYFYHLAMQKNMRKIRRVIPSLTFKKKLYLCGMDRELHLIAFEKGHTNSDVVLFLPEDGIVFMADLLCVGYHPFLEEGEPQALLNILNEIGNFDADKFVPGHGQVGSQYDLACMEEYVSTLKHLADNNSHRELSEDCLDDIPIPRQFSQWDFSQLFHSNLRSYFERSNGEV